MMNKMTRAIAAALGTMALLGAAASAVADEVEVLHYWTSGGEARAIEELKSMMKAKGVSWTDFGVEGDNSAMATLSARQKAGNAVTAAQGKQPGMIAWGREGVLANIDVVAKREDWDSVLSKAVSDSAKFQGNYGAAPISVHRENWLWINAEVLARAGASVPTTFEEFFETAEKIKRAGMIPIAHGGQPWQDTLMLQSVVLGVGGPAFYEKVFVQRDNATLTGPTMIKVFETMGRMKQYIDKYSPGREWNMATSMVIHAKGGMQFMGDWAKGDFVTAGKVPGKDFLCVATPGTEKGHIYTIDSLVMFAVKGKSKEDGQAILAETIMSPQFQEVFNLNKGSIPARLGIPRTKFDICATKSMDDMAAASKTGNLVPSMAMAMSNEMAGTFKSVTNNFMNSNMTPQEAVTTLAKELIDPAKTVCAGRGECKKG